MSRSSWLVDRMRGWAAREALAGDWGSVSYGGLLELMEAWIATLNDAGIGPGQVIAFESDFCDKTVALFWP